MEQVHLHLIITHLPIVGSFIGALVLVWGIMYKSQPTKNIAFIVLLLSAIGAAIANFTGEAAEEVVEKIAGISHDVIHEHEEAAELAFILQMIMGAFALLSYFLAYRKSGFARIASIVTLLIGLAAFVMVARAGYYGGLIRHPEVNGAAAVVSPPAQNKG
ncbi:MAG: hypothetical protein ACRC3B_01475, partial [Bacteroidia bacterium]